MARPVREQLRLAIWRALRGIPLSGLQRWMLAAPSAEVCRWVMASCAKLGLSPLAYGRHWEVWHRRPLRAFDLKRRSDFLAANCLSNLEVRPVRGGRGKEALP